MFYAHCFAQYHACTTVPQILSKTERFNIPMNPITFYKRNVDFNLFVIFRFLHNEQLCDVDITAFAREHLLLLPNTEEVFVPDLVVPNAIQHRVFSR